MPSARVVFPATDRAEIAAAISQVLATGALTLGPHTADFEAAFAAAHTGSGGQPHAVAVASGTAALDIALRVVGVRGRDVVVPANTFYAPPPPSCRPAAGRSSRMWTRPRSR